MPKTETQTIKSQSVHQGDVVIGADGRKGTVDGVTAKVKWITIHATMEHGITRNLRFERNDDVQVERQVPTATEKRDRVRETVLDEIHRFVNGALTARNAARAKLVEHVEKDFRIDWNPLTTLAEADARWEIAVHLVPGKGVEVTDDMLINEARHLIAQETDALLDDRYRGQSTNPMSNALEASKRAAASQFVGRSWGLGAYLRMLDAAQAEVDAEQN